MTLQLKSTRRRFLQASTASLAGVAAAGLLRSTAAAQSTVSSTTQSSSLDEITSHGPVDDAYWRKVRSRFILSNDRTFFNNGTAGPASKDVLAVHERVDREIAETPYDPFHLNEVVKVRQQIADFINASPEEVFFTHSTTDGVNIFAHGLDFKPGDEVLIARDEHPGGYQVYQTIEQRQGIKIVWLDLPAPPDSPEQVVDIYRKAITPRTRLILVSHVFFVTGLLAPVKELTELAHSKGILISVDGAQSNGILPIDVKELGFDHYAGPGQKWLLAGTGTGFTYVPKALHSKVWPLHGYDVIGAPQPYPILRYEKSGQPNIPAWIGIGAAINLQLAIGKQNIERRDRQLATRLKTGLREIPGVKLYTSLDPKLSASLTTFSVNGASPDTVVNTLIEKDKIYIRTIIEDDIKAVRASTHFYNSPDEVDHLISAVQKIAASAGKATA
jgi:selenocysteine lyase/cysteine desulfurase